MNKEVESALLEAKKTETDFVEFYYTIISRLFDLKCRQSLRGIKSSLMNIRKAKQGFSEPQESTHFRANFSFSDRLVRCAYMYAYSVLNSVAVHSEFSFLLGQNKNRLLPFCEKNVLKLCCLGGGPGTEVVALCKYMNDFILKSCTRNAKHEELKVSVTILHQFSHWRVEESAVINGVTSFCNFRLLKGVKLQTKFVETDLLKPFKESIKEQIQEADIVTIVKISESIQFKPKNFILNLQNMIKNVIESMREDSILFVLDSAGGNIFKCMTEVLQEKKATSCFKTSLHKDHHLDVNSVKTFSDLLISKNDTSSPPLITGKGKVSSCVWIKSADCVVEASGSSSVKQNVPIEKTENTNLSSLESGKREDTAESNTKNLAAMNMENKSSVTDKKIASENQAKIVRKKKTKVKCNK